jgi:hypothetical protein
VIVRFPPVTSTKLKFTEGPVAEKREDEIEREVPDEKSKVWMI